MTHAFEKLKLALQTAHTLRLPDPNKPFIQIVDERDGCMMSVAYFSAKLDAVAAGLPHCLHAAAAAEKALLSSRDVVSYSDVTLMVPHAVTLILKEQRTSHLSCYLRYHTFIAHAKYNH